MEKYARKITQDLQYAYAHQYLARTFRSLYKIVFFKVLKIIVNMIFATNSLILDSFKHGENSSTIFCIHDHNDVLHDLSPVFIIFQNNFF